MTTISWPTALIAALTGAAGALAVTAFTMAPQTTTANNAAASPSQASSPAARSAEVAAAPVADALALLSNDVARLAARVEELERRSEPETRIALASPRERDANSAAGSAKATLAPEVVQESVATALDAIRAEERAKAEAERQKRELERLEERLARLNERLGLSPDQTNMMRALMLAQNTQRDELERMRTQGVEREQRRVVAEDMERRRTIELARILSTEQLAGLREFESGRGDDRGRARRPNTGGDANTGGRGRRGG